MADYNISHGRITTYDIYVFITALSWLTITLAMGGSLQMIYMFLLQHQELADYNISHGRITTFDIYVFITTLSWLTIALVIGGSLHMIYMFLLQH